MKDEEVRDLGARTREYALRVIRLADALPRSAVGKVLGTQVLLSGTSVGAHYREAHRARSNAEVVSKLEGALQELEESAYWLELIRDAELQPSERLEPLLTETNELISILVTMVKRVKARAKR